MSTDDDNSDYKVGYKRPPLEHRFKEGRSGNPDGSKPKPNDIAGFTDKHLKKKRWVKGEDGRRLLLTSEEIIAMQQVDKAARGDHRATKAIQEHQRTRVKPKLEVTTVDREAVKAALDRLAEERAAAVKPEPQEPPASPGEERPKEDDDGWR